MDQNARLLRLWADGHRSSRDVRALTKLTLATSIAALQESRATLDALVEACNGDHRPACPIIESLEGHLARRPRSPSWLISTTQVSVDIRAARFCSPALARKSNRPPRCSHPSMGVLEGEPP